MNLFNKHLGEDISFLKQIKRQYDPKPEGIEIRGTIESIVPQKLVFGKYGRVRHTDWVKDIIINIKTPSGKTVQLEGHEILAYAWL